MARRTNDLTEIAKPIAESLADQTGSLKRVLSAGVMAFNELGPARRQYYIAKAGGVEISPESESPSEDEVYREIVKLADQWKLTNEKIRAFQAANRQNRKFRRRDESG